MGFRLIKIKKYFTDIKIDKNLIWQNNLLCVKSDTYDSYVQISIFYYDRNTTYTFLNDERKTCIRNQMKTIQINGHDLYFLQG